MNDDAAQENEAAQEDEKEAEGLVSLGFRDVPPAEKTRAVGAIFARVASRYDLMNDLMSGGLHRHWKNLFVRHLNPRPGERILDLAGGTGDIAFRIARRTETGTGGGAEVTVGDINAEMLRVGAERAQRRGMERVEFRLANAEELPFDDGQFDAVTIAFGIRNVTRIDAALREIRRVLKWGGRFFCLEFSTVEWPGFSRLYDSYSLKVVPEIGRFVARDRDAYQYLVESIRRFPPMPEFARMVRAAGFGAVKVEPILGGVVAIHSGWKV